MNKRTIVIPFIAFISFSTGHSQSHDVSEMKSARNVIYLSYGGSGIYFALNYERQIFQLRRFSGNAHIGVATSFSSALFLRDYVFPIGINLLYGKRNSHVELDFSASNYLIEQYEYSTDRKNRELKILLVPTIAYRFQKNSGGLFFKAGFSSIINTGQSPTYLTPWINLCAGYSF